MLTGGLPYCAILGFRCLSVIADKQLNQKNDNLLDNTTNLTSMQLILWCHGGTFRRYRRKWG